MASELRVNTLKDAAGNNSIATSFVANGSAKAWINFNGTGTVAIRDSFSVSSISDAGTGNYDINLASAMANANYANSGMSADLAAGAYVCYESPSTIATTAIGIYIFTSGSAIVDNNLIAVNFDGDLA